MYPEAGCGALLSFLRGFVRFVFAWAVCGLNGDEALVPLIIWFARFVPLVSKVYLRQMIMLIVRKAS